MMHRSIESCVNQSFSNFEIIIVDDGSTDNTEETISKYTDSRIIYIKQVNSGASTARNTGAGQAKGKYLAFLDSDDEFLPGKLSAFYDTISQFDSEDTVFYSPLYFHRGAGNRLRKPERAIATGESVGDYLFADDGMMQTSTLVIPRQLFQRVRFNPRMRNLEDLDLCLRLEAAGARFHMLPDPQVVWYDETADGRLSYTTTAENIRLWLAANGTLLSRKAYYGFLARYLVPIAIRDEPKTSIKTLASAIRHRSISGKRALYILLRGATPNLYTFVRDTVVKLRSA